MVPPYSGIPNLSHQLAEVGSGEVVVDCVTWGVDLVVVDVVLDVVVVSAHETSTIESSNTKTMPDQIIFLLILLLFLFRCLHLFSVTGQCRKLILYIRIDNSIILSVNLAVNSLSIFLLAISYFATSMKSVYNNS